MNIFQITNFIQFVQDVKACLRTNDPFYLIAYSYGTYVALQIASMLEKAGFRGQLMLIDGAPHFLTKLTRLHLENQMEENDLYNMLFCSIVNQIFPEETKDSIGLVFATLPTLKEKMDKFMEYVAKQDLYSALYSEQIVHAMYRRIRMAANFDLDAIEKINSPIMLVRPSEVSLQDIDEDYCLSKCTKGKVTVKAIAGNHTTMLDNPMLVQFINDYDPSSEEDKKFEQYIRDSKPSVAPW